MSLTVARRFNSTESGFQEVTAWIPGGKPKSVKLNPDWQTAEYEELPDGRIVMQQEAQTSKGSKKEVFNPDDIPINHPAYRKK